MRVRVRFFAGTRDAVGASQRDVDVPEPATVEAVFTFLSAQHPRLARYRDHALFALNGAFSPLTAAVREGDEVAIMPPVSGGDGPRLVDPARFSLDDLVARTRVEGAGAVVAFEGLVRASSGERPDARVALLEFEAFEALAEQALLDVRDEAVAKFSLTGATLRHRTGSLRVGEPIVAVVVAARHRREAFEAAAWIMEELKTRVPIWKREVDASGMAHWVNDPVPDEV